MPKDTAALDIVAASLGFAFDFFSLTPVAPVAEILALVGAVYFLPKAGTEARTNIRLLLLLPPAFWPSLWLVTVLTAFRFVTISFMLFPFWLVMVVVGALTLASWCWRRAGGGRRFLVCWLLANAAPTAIATILPPLAALDIYGK